MTKILLSPQLTNVKTALQEAVKSREGFKRFTRTKDSDTTGSWSWVNIDLLPTPAEKRIWGLHNYIYFYSSLALDSWTLGSGLIGIGLNWWQAILACFFSQAIGALASAANSRCAGVYHLGYPAVARSVFGMYGAYYVVAARAVLAAVYFAIKVYQGSSFVDVMLRAIFGSGYTNVPNHLPASIDITSRRLLAFFLYWLIHIPFVFLRPNQYRWLFTIKLFVMIPTMIGLFMFCMINTHANLGLEHLQVKSTKSIGWLFMYGLNSGLGTHSTLVTNQPDFSRWSRSKAGSTWTLIVYPFSATIAATFGILSTAAINNTWHLKLWNQWDLLGAVLERYSHPSARFAVFLCAFCWAILTLGTNIAANMIAFGSDCAMMIPRYLDMKRGQVLVLVLAWLLFPWKILASATTFNNFLSGYGIFMGGVSGIMIVEYYLWSRGNVFTEFLFYPPETNTHYRYLAGWNAAAFVAYIAGCAIPLPGFAGKLGAHIGETAIDLYYLGWLTSFFVAMLVYSAICAVRPTNNQREIARFKLGYEQNAPNGDFDLVEYTRQNGVLVGHAEIGMRDVAEGKE